MGNAFSPECFLNNIDDANAKNEQLYLSVWVRIQLILHKLKPKYYIKITLNQLTKLLR